MKSLNEFVNESVVNESIVDALLIAQCILTYILVGLFDDAFGKGYMLHPGEMIADIKRWATDVKVSKIAKRLANDKEVQSFLMNNDKDGWKNILLKKLSKDEIQYISQLTKLKVDAYIDYDKLTD
jgi:hypothetical protein